MSVGRTMRWRWVVALATTTLFPLVLVAVFGHRGVHAVNSLVVPGSGLVEKQPALGAIAFAMAVAATVAWLRWGMDWSLLVVVGLAMAASGAWGTGDGTSGVSGSTSWASHEFPIVVLLAGALGWMRSTIAGVPGFRWTAGRRVAESETRHLPELRPADRCRAAAMLGLAGCADDGVRRAISTPDVARRARRVGFAARCRRGGDPFRIDHAHARAAFALTGAMNPPARQRFLADAACSPAGVPASEPTWVRPFDGTLAAVALDQLGDRTAAENWKRMLTGPLGMRRGHRPAWWWSPLGLAAGRCLDWEHAASTAIAHSRGWIGDEDWLALRQRVLGAAARGGARRDDERLIASGRAWLALLDDADAESVVNRATVCRDPLAVAIDRFADHLRTNGAARAPERAS